MYRNQKPAFDSFTDLLVVVAKGEINRERLRLVSWSSSCAVTIEESAEVEEQDGRLLFRCDSADEFAIDVIEALGGTGMIA